jgi:exoribonuclease R
MTKEVEKKLMYWKFQGWESFGFFIPEDRDLYGWDFYVTKENFGLAQDWDKVEARELKKFKWKKPEAKIITVYWRSPQKNQVKYIEWIYSGWDGNFGFIDIEWNEKWFFVYWKKKNWAKDWDKVKAEIVDFNGKKEAIVVKIFKTEDELVIWRYKDNDKFGFVLPDETKNNDIFIAWSRKNWASNGDMVEVKIIKKWGKNPEGVIVRIIKI